MGVQLPRSYCHGYLATPRPPPPLQSLQSPSSLCTGSSSATSLLCLSYQFAQYKSQKYEAFRLQKSLGLSFAHGRGRRRRRGVGSSAGNVSAAAPLSWDDWSPQKDSKAPPLSDVVWPAAGAFVAMAVLGKMDQMLAAKGVSMTIAPLGAVCAVLFATPSSPAARKYNMFVAQIGCAAFGVLAFSMFGPGWIARSAGLAAAVAFMIYTRAIHPPAASLPILFIDGVKLHKLNFWYAFFPGAAGCILLCLIQVVVCYLRNNFKF